MEPHKTDLSLVTGTTGQYAVAWSEWHGEWIVCLFRRSNGHQPDWTFVASRATDELARQLAHGLYARDLAGEAYR